MAPQNPDFTDTLGWILVETGNPEEGLPYLRDAHTRAASNLEIRYHIAVALYRLDRKEEALAELKAILTERKARFPSRGDAEALYATLK